MKATCALVLVVSLGIVIPHAQEAPVAVRAMDPGAVEACAHGRASSASFRALVASFDPEHVVVHVETGTVRIFGTAGATRLVGTAGPWRYVRITVDPDLPLDARTAVIAHELQHAHEIAEASAATQAQVRQLFERIGRPVQGAVDTYETGDAITAGQRVWRELRTAAARTRALARAAKAAPETAGTAVRVQ
jgi:arginine/ornithine N-succinyltransferase beta subunit